MSRKHKQKTADNHGFVAIRLRDIERQVERSVFSRGEALYRQKAMLDPIVQGEVIRALCDSGVLYPTVVEATLNRPGNRDTNPGAYSCTCPEDGFCEHVVALLLTWIDDPGRFMPIQTMTDRLGEKSRDELVDIIERMLAASPDLIRLVDSPQLVAPITAPVRGVTAGTIARQVREDLEPFRLYRPVPGSHPPGSMRLQQVISVAWEQASQGRWSDAVTMLRELASELMPVGRHYQGEDSQLFVILAAADGGLFEAMQVHSTLPPRNRLSADNREALIRTLYAIWRFFSLEVPQLGIEGAGLLRSAQAMTNAERQMVDGWVTSEKVSEPWAVDLVVRLRAALLEATPGREEDLLTLYRKSGWWEAYASVLLQLGRVDEAVAIAEQHLLDSGYTIGLYGKMIGIGEPGSGDLGALMQGFPWRGDPKSVVRAATIEYWLMTEFLELDQPRNALEYARRYFARRPDFERWEELRSIARHPGLEPGTWESMHGDLVDIMLEAGRWLDVIEVHLEEGDIRAALDTHAGIDCAAVRKPRPWGFGMTPDLLDLQEIERELATAAAQEFPDQAVGIYLTQAESFIAQRKRPSYQQAADVLKEARQGLKSHGRTADWKPIVADIRQRYSSLRALREELDAAKL